MLEGFQFLRRDLDRHTFTHKREPEILAASGQTHAALLASPDGDAYTGQTLDPNGGVVMN